MAEFSEFYSTIDDITSHLRTDFIGPVKYDEVLEYEDPLSRYSLGILWPQPVGKSELKDAENPEELFEDNSEDSEIPLNLNIYKPSSMALSFTLNEGDLLDITFLYASYVHEEKVTEATESEKEKVDNIYRRKSEKFHTELIVPNKISNTIISEETELPIMVYLHVRRIYSDNTRLVTVSVLNKNKADDNNLDMNKKSLFQCHLSVKSKKGFMPVYTRNSKKSVEEETSDMLYDAVHNYSYGHGCSSLYKSENGIVTEVYSEFIPQHRLLQMMPRLIPNAEYLYMQYWKDADRKPACNGLSGFINEYENWLENLKSSKKIIAKYSVPSSVSFENIKQCIGRLRDGIKCLETNDLAWQAFKYMNEAMLWQRVKTKRCKPDTVSWYPFQMAYVLQIIPDIVNNENPFHDKVDLLWFPTGGGKTEAYLGLSAFTIFYRRLTHKSGNDCDGVTIIMRYTLRLLTIQQFERATALICACEYMRKLYNIPGNEISIGLWIGSGMTPNHTKEAEETLNKMREDSTVKIYEANPMQITKCPWCGSEIGIGGYSVEFGRMNIKCEHNHECEFRHHLPIYVIDDDIYAVKPTLLLSTVDKFARLTWEEKSGQLLGAGGNKPPELIIQDELHLISGPLGSITGIYEIAIEEISKHYNGNPKIIASTATVKNADKQIKILYNRDMIQFPPNGLSYDDSFFAIEASQDKRPARTYTGICSIGGTSSEMLIKIFALLVFLKYLYKKQNKPHEVVDQFFTTVGYFNSLKELGTSAIIVTDRIFTEIKYLVSHKFKDEALKYDITVDVKNSLIPPYFNNGELTSRNSAKEIKDVLEQLTNRFTDDNCFDYVMSSNMLSVGIDIDRLGVMSMYGQPKSNSEYIQATSRVGRTNPGLVISIYSGMRSRDKSYYEQFDYYHTTFYKYVESTSVTSYSPRAIEKALHCAFLAIIRHTLRKYNSNSSACKFKSNDMEIEIIKNNIIRRVNDIEPRMAGYAGEWLDWYLECWEELVYKLPDTLVYYDYHNSDISLFRSADNDNGSDIPTILNSVRNVEQSSDIYFSKR